MMKIVNNNMVLQNGERGNYADSNRFFGQMNFGTSGPSD